MFVSLVARWVQTINQYGDNMWLVVSTALSRLLPVGLARGKPGSEVRSWLSITLIRAKSTCLLHRLNMVGDEELLENNSYF